jgi:hypothetical protein
MLEEISRLLLLFWNKPTVSVTFFEEFCLLFRFFCNFYKFFRLISSSFSVVWNNFSHTTHGNLTIWEEGYEEEIYTVLTRRYSANIIRNVLLLNLANIVKVGSIL